MKNERPTIREREAVRRVAARAVARAGAISDTPVNRELKKDVEDLAYAVDVLCDVIAHLEFHR
jgi:hypothetical protein